jgi:hypothetical protein
MIQSPASPRAPKASPALFIPPATEPSEQRERTRAALAEVDEHAIFREPPMESALKPLMWLLVPFVLTLAYGFLSG